MCDFDPGSHSDSTDISRSSLTLPVKAFEETKTNGFYERFCLRRKPLLTFYVHRSAADNYKNVHYLAACSFRGEKYKMLSANVAGGVSFNSTERSKSSCFDFGLISC